MRHLNKSRTFGVILLLLLGAVADAFWIEPILIAHNPDIFPEVPDRVSLLIAGHTHGGHHLLSLSGGLR